MAVERADDDEDDDDVFSWLAGRSPYSENEWFRCASIHLYGEWVDQLK